MAGAQPPVNRSIAASCDGRLERIVLLCVVFRAAFVVLENPLQSINILLRTARPRVALAFQSIICGDGDTSCSPAIVTWSTICSRLVFHIPIMDDLVLIRALSGPEVQHLVHQPTIAEVFGIDHAAVSEFHTLTRVVYPSKVKVKCGLNNPEDNRNRIPVMLRSKATNEPVQDIESSIRSQGN